MKNEEKERFHTSQLHIKTEMRSKRFFYFVHEANAFVMLRFSFEIESLNVGSFHDIF